MYMRLTCLLISGLLSGCTFVSVQASSTLGAEQIKQMLVGHQLVEVHENSARPEPPYLVWEITPAGHIFSALMVDMQVASDGSIISKNGGPEWPLLKDKNWAWAIEDEKFCVRHQGTDDPMKSCYMISMKEGKFHFDPAESGKSLWFIISNDTP